MTEFLQEWNNSMKDLGLDILVVEPYVEEGSDIF